jgi:hypothetical protein
MPYSTASRNEVTRADSSIADDHADDPLNASIQRAMTQQHFADDVSLTARGLTHWPEYPQARQELFASFLWLKTLLPGGGEVEVTRSAVGHMAWSLSGPVGLPMTDDQFALFGSGKRDLLALCEALSRDQQPSTVAAACRELRLAFDAAGGSGISPAVAIGGALTEVVAESSAARRLVPSAPPLSLIADAPLPRTDNATLSAALSRIGVDGLRSLCTRFGADVDRLIALIPHGVHASLRDGLISMRDRYATPPDVFQQEDAEMLDGGHVVLTALCDELNRHDPAGRRRLLNDLTHDGRGYARVPCRVNGLARMLVKAESFRTGVEDPHLEARSRRLEAWAQPQLDRSKLKKREVEDALQVLGLHQPTTVIDGPLADMGAVRNNAAWRICLGHARGADGEHPLADVGNADLASALGRLRARCDDLVVTDTTALDSFANHWLKKTPSGGQDDRVGNLQTFGVGALDRLCERLARKGDRGNQRATLIRMMEALAKTENPASLLLHYARYELPFDPATTQEDSDVLRREIVQREVRAASRTLLAGSDAAIVDQAVGRACRGVQALLGIRAADGDPYTPEIGGLIDTSSTSLDRLNEAVRRGINS